MDFPPYVFRPFPAWVTGPDGKDVIVNSEVEKAALLGETEDHAHSEPAHEPPVAPAPELPVEPAHESASESISASTAS